MDKELKAYRTQMEHRLLAIQPSQADRLLRYHVERVRDFQHERLVHLLVTLFFGALVVIAVGSLFLFQTSMEPAVERLLDGAVVLLLLTELFYVAHYYQLENGVQKLYPITKRLSEKAGL